jgi:hypothetical protein
MAVTVVEEAGGTILTDGTLQTIGAALNAAGMFFLRLDLSPLVAATTANVIEISESMAVRASGTVRVMEGSPITYTGGLNPLVIETPHRSIPESVSLTYKIKRVAGADFTYTYSIIEVG